MKGWELYSLTNSDNQRTIGCTARKTTPNSDVNLWIQIGDDGGTGLAFTGSKWNLEPGHLTSGSFEFSNGLRVPFTVPQYPPSLGVYFYVGDMAASMRSAIKVSETVKVYLEWAGIFGNINQTFSLNGSSYAVDGLERCVDSAKFREKMPHVEPDDVSEENDVASEADAASLSDVTPASDADAYDPARYGMLEQQLLAGRTVLVEQANAQIQLAHQQASQKVSRLSAYAEAARASGNVGQMVRYRTQADAALSEYENTELSIRQGLETAMMRSEHALLVAEILRSIAEWQNEGNSARLTGVWTKLLGSAIVLEMAGPGRFHIITVVRDGEGRRRTGSDGKVVSFTATEVSDVFLGDVLPFLALAIGPLCHPSYEGACVPIAADVDCLGGIGDGPRYPDRAGPFRRVGPDYYGLDRDNDGRACEAEDFR